MALLSAFVTGCSGTALTRDEWRFMQDARPAGFILFDRNCQSPEQVRELIDSFKDAVGRDNLLVMVDQEGGRVQRLRPPNWRRLPPAAAYGALYEQEPGQGLRAATAASQLVGVELRRLGFNMNCAPVLDIPVPGAHGVIGDRAYGFDVEQVTALGRAVAEGLLRGGVLPVIKHVPGHGRATRDSHEALPVIDAPLDELEAVDFAPFRALADLPAAMTAHVVLEAVDPRSPVSTSARAIEEVVRGSIGFQGLLISDDLSMRALDGGIGQRAEGVIAAGCDLALHCNGRLVEMIEVVERVPMLEGEAEARFEAAFDRLKSVEAFDVSEALKALKAAISVAG
ncbi:MAG: beta-N-acetylhexosaminidase [Hyphomicrobiaceae bacterium]